ncbi:MAG: type IV pilus assembly protein PilM [Chitinophagales bacterium]
MGGNKLAGVGVEIRSNVVRAAALKPGRGQDSIVACAEEKLAPGVMENGSIRDKDALTIAITNVWKALAVKEKRVVTSVSGQQTIVRTMKMPGVDDKSLKTAARYQAASVLPIPMEEAAVEIAGYVKKSESMDTEVTVVAVRRMFVEEIAAVMRQAGLEPTVVEISPIAAFRVLGGEEDCEAIMDMGTTSTVFSIFEHGCLKFARTVQTGSMQFLSLAADERGINLEEAAATIMDIRQSNNLEFLANELITEIRRSIEYYNIQSGRTIDIKCLSLTGTGLGIGGLLDFVKGSFNFRVEPGNPLKSIALTKDVSGNEKERIKQYYSVALGLAARRRG